MDKYQVKFSFSDVSLSEQDRVYNKLMSVLDNKLKDKLDICITDSISGEHYVRKNIGKRPDCYVCKECYEIDCAKCYVWKERKDECPS